MESFLLELTGIRVGTLPFGKRRRRCTKLAVVDIVRGLCSEVVYDKKAVPRTPNMRTWHPARSGCNEN